MLNDVHEMTVGMENKLNLDLTIEPMRHTQDGGNISNLELKVSKLEIA